MRSKKLHGHRKKGGLRIAQRFIERRVTSWQLIWMIISDPDTEVTCLAFESLKGFLYTVQIPPHLQDVFLDLNDAGTRFDKPVKSLVLKFGVLTANAPDRELKILRTPTRSIRKRTDVLNNFAQEASLQQKIYISTVGQHGQAVCPAVVDFSYFTSDSAIYLLEELEKRCNDINSKKMTEFLLTEFQTNSRSAKDYMLGLIAMQVGGTNFVPIYTLSGYPDIYNEACIRAISQFIRLAVEAKIANYDSHAANILSKQDGTKTYLIDFGRVVDLQNDSQDVLSSFTPDEQMSIRNVYKNIYRKRTPPIFQDFDADYAKIAEIINEGVTFFHFTPESEHHKEAYISTRDEIITRMNELIKFIAELDYAINRTLYSLNKPQMSGVLESFYGPDRAPFSGDWPVTPPNFDLNPALIDKYIEVAALFRAETIADTNRVRSATSPANIRALVNNGAFFSNIKITDPTPYNRGNTDNWYIDPNDIPPIREESICDQMGRCFKRIKRSFGYYDGGGKTKRIKNKRRRSHFRKTKSKR